MRKTILFGALLGLIISGSVALLSHDTYLYYIDSQDSKQLGLCDGLSEPLDVLYKVSAGAPLKWESRSIAGKLNQCSVGAEQQLDTTQVAVSYVWSWQFLANWLILSIPFTVIIYLIRKRNPH